MNGAENLNSVLAAIEEKGKAYFYTRGTSMLPMIKEGRDISVLVPLTREPRRGDVVLFVRRRKDDELVLHRVIKNRGNVIIIRGDNTYFDEPVKREDIFALLEGFFRKGKYRACDASARYRIYSFIRMNFYPLRKFVRHTMRAALAKVKNNVFHLNGLHLDDILGKNRSE